MKKRLMIGTTAFSMTLMLFPLTASAVNENQNLPIQNFRDVSDIIGPITPPNTGTDENDKGDGELVTLPNTEEFQTNEDFKKYDPAYPTKEQYGDYVLQVPELKERLTFSTGSNNQMIGTLYAPGISKDGGWKDATKKWGHYDFGLCFAASSSNLISWYLDRYLKLHPEDTNTYVTHEEEVFDRFRNGWDSSKGGNQTEALSWYFTGGFPSGNPQAQDNQLTGNEKGGYLRNKLLNNKSERWANVSLLWKPQEIFTVYGGYEDDKFPFIEEVGGMSGNGAFSNLRGFSDQILRQLHYGVTTISILTDNSVGGSGHAITLWGADYDVKTGLVTAIHVTDSDDVNRGKFTVSIAKGNDDSEVKMEDYTYHPPVGNSQKFTRIRDSIVLYAPEVVRSIKKPTLNVQVEGQKRIDLSSNDAKSFSLKTTGNELDYIPEYHIQFKDPNGQILSSDQISTKYDIFKREFSIMIKNQNLTPGTYTAVITEKYTKQKFEESFEFYKDKQKLTYTVTFHANQGSGSMNVQQFENDVEQALSNNQFIRTGYTFKGWSKQPNGQVEYQNGDKVTNLTTQDGKNIDLYAVWEANTYTVTFDANGGIGTMKPQKMTYDQVATLATNQYTKPGYTFKGWSTQANGQVVYTNNKEVKNLVTEGNITLYAVWEANAYTVTFDANDGTGTMNPQNMTYDQVATLAANQYTKSGYTFKGWSTQSNGKVVYTNSEEVSNLVTEGNITLYAVWQANTYTVTFHANQGSGSMNVQQFENDVEQALSNNQFIRTGYTFKGWSKQPNGQVEYQNGDKVINLSTQDGKNVDLYAVWEANIYTVTFDANGGIGTMNPQNMTYDQVATLATNQYTKLGYTFKGWSTTKSSARTRNYANGEEVSNLATEGNITLYAVWEANTYTVTFDANGGTGTMNPQKMTYDQLATLAANQYTKSGYTFKGWSTQANGKVVYTNNKEVSNLVTEGNITLYAVWEANKITPINPDQSNSNDANTPQIENTPSDSNTTQNENTQNSVNTQSSANTPQTGSTTNTQLFVSMLISTLGLFVITLNKKRKNNHA